MSKLDELIAELCPNGVEYKLFFDVCDYIRGITYNKNDEINNNSYGIEVLRANNITLETNTLIFDDVKLISENVKIKKTQWLKKNDILICAGSGSKEHIGKVAYIFADTNITFGGFMGVVRPKIKNFSTRFLFHILTSDMFKRHLAKVSAASSSTINNINNDTWKNFQIPVPPLPVQEEIVRILDKFTSLTAELTVRRKQYEYYRDALLTPPFGSTTLTDRREHFGSSIDRREHFEILTDRGEHYDRHAERNNQIRLLGSTGSPTKARLLSGAEASEIKDTMEAKVEIKKLGEIAEITRGGNFQKKDFVENGLPCIHYGQMYTHFGTWTDKTLTFVSKDIFEKSKKAQPNDIVMAVTSENVEDVCKCTAWVGNEPIAVSGHTAIIHHTQNAKYLSYYFQSELFYRQKVKLAHGTKVIEVTPDKLKEITIPLPPLSVQQRIVNVLDNFDAICSDLKIGLPAEIDARKKQYEYYRDKLLSFRQAR